MSASAAIPEDALESALVRLLRLLDRPMSVEALRARVAKAPGPWSVADVREAAESLGIACEDYPSRAPKPQALRFPSLLVSREGLVAVIEGAKGGQGARFQVWLPGADAPLELGWHELVQGHEASLEAFSLRPRVLLGGAVPAGAPQGRYGHWFWGPLLQSRALYQRVGIAALMVNLFAMATSIFSMVVYNSVIPNNATDTLIALLIGIGLVFVSDFLIRTLRGYFLDVAGARADMVIGDTLFEQLLDMRMSVRRGPTGSLANVLKEFESLREFLTSTTLVTLIDIPFSILFLVVIGLIGGPIVWVPLLVIPLMIGAGLLVQPRMKALVDASTQEGHSKQGVLVETLSGLETIKALGAGAMMRRRWQKAVITQSELALNQRMWSSFAANVANLSQQLVQVGVITVGFFLVGQGKLGFGAIIACTILSGRAISPLAQLAQLLTRVNQSLTSYRSLSELMSAPREHAGGEHYVSRPGFEGAIEFRDVTFTYPGATRPALRGVSFRLAPGEKLAVLGRAGSGKTTLSKLVLGLYQPDEGSVLLDGVDVRQIDPAELRARVGAVLQDVWLIAGSVRENITLGSHTVSDETLVRAARLAGVEDFISQHPQGYGLRLGERGEGLSGGQRQAVALARALVGDPPILVLDEPSSAMDQSAETKLVERLKTALEGRTVLLITHKAGIMALAERVLVLEEGKAVFDGPPAKLLGGSA